MFSCIMKTESIQWITYRLASRVRTNAPHQIRILTSDCNHSSHRESESTRINPSCFSVMASTSLWESLPGHRQNAARPSRAQHSPIPHHPGCCQALRFSLDRKPLSCWYYIRCGLMRFLRAKHPRGASILIATARYKPYATSTVMQHISKNGEK